MLFLLRSSIDLIIHISHVTMQVDNIAQILLLQYTNNKQTLSGPSMI